MRQSFAAFLASFIFALGLGVSGMTQPQKVLGFLNIADWDPSLIFVMIGAIAVHASLYPFLRRRQKPLLAEKFHVPENKNINVRLVVGSLLFGIGWGFAGYCPGPAIVSLATLNSVTWVFVGWMILGMLIFHWLHRSYARR